MKTLYNRLIIQATETSSHIKADHIISALFVLLFLKQLKRLNYYMHHHISP